MLCLWVQVYFDFELPADSKIEKAFREHRSDLEQLVAMAEQDHFMARISNDFTNPSIDDVGTSFSLERWNKYRRLFKKVGAKDGIINRGRVHILFGELGFLSSSIEKGIGRFDYVRKEVGRDSLDKLPETIPHGTYFFKHLDRDWFMYVLTQ